MTRRDEILERISEVVAIPSCAQKAAALLGDPDADFDELARIIEYDPGLTANLLKVVNASFFSGGTSAMRTSQEAIKRLGTTQVLQFVISTGVAPSFVRKIEGYDLSPTMHLQHSVTVALSAQELGTVLGLNPPDYTFTAGLLSGIGKTLLGAYVQVNAHPILDLAMEHGLSFDQAEDKILGINHAELGGLVLESWGLPKEITDVVRHHLRPDEFGQESLVLDLVHIGNVLAKMIGVGLGVDGLNYAPSHIVAERLKLTPEILDIVSANVVSSLDSLWDLFLECAEEACPI
ncbi:HDOD domain-containing protein [Pseudodesulfovibrio piezophilus]|uniref:Putative signal transduction protein n=1 Tax=Pseudodesulfovibrio piezophilus (strain DSM 21447 / JCM 15486 / C1TLV30) TaxID=1322246 RepID=M1WTB0_PSEP2|nr:HDOD domain-containing protein [Pseudodesulfovibrio piezophilus]CCH49397.1 putative signal transduction protein [Pseudodesulfovibrio piezophilus C1TLV30]